MKKIALIIFTAIFTVTLNAQQTLDLNKCISIALENNHDHKQVTIDRKKAEEQVREAYGSSLFPSINSTVTYSRAIKRPRFIIETPFFSGSFPAGSKNTLTASVNAEQPLFTGAMFLAVEIAETFADISKRVEEYSEGELVLKVKQAYYTYLLAEELVHLAGLQLKRAEENLNNTKSKYNAGLVAEYDYIKANVQYQNAIPQLTEAENQIELAANNLKLVMGLELSKDFSIVDSLSYRNFKIVDEEEGLSRVINNNKMIQQMKLQAKMQDLVKSYEFTEHLPKLSAFGNWQTQAQEDDRSFSDWRYFNSLSVGLTLKVPIFQGFAQSSRVEQAELDWKKSVEGLASVKQTVTSEFENTIKRIKKNKEQISAYEAARDEAKRGYEISVKRYDTGLSTQLEVTDALLGLTSSEINLLTSIHEYYINLAQLDLLLGKNLNELYN